MGYDFWDKYYRPVACLRLKQGFGRLMRSETDRGTFVVLDRRIWDDNKMSPMMDELPVRLVPFSNKRTQGSDSDLGSLVQKSLANLGLSPEYKERKIELGEVASYVASFSSR